MFGGARSKRFVVGSLCAMGLLGASCAPETSLEGRNGRSVEFWTMQLRPSFDDYIGGVLREWERQHPGVTVRWVDLPASEIESKTLTAIASGQSPDLVNLNPMFANKLATAGALKKLVIPPADRQLYYEAAWQANTVRGAVVGVPWYLSTTVTFYNRELWRRFDLPDGKWPTNYAELAQVATQIRERSGKMAYAFMPHFGDRGKFMEELALDGVPLLSADQSRAGFDSQKAQHTLQFWSDLLTSGTLPREGLTQGHREAIDRFQGAQTVLFPAGPQFLKMIKQNAPGLYANIAVGPQIAGESGDVGVAVMNVVIPTGSKEPELAYDLARFVTNDANQLAFARLVPILPSTMRAARLLATELANSQTLEQQAHRIGLEQLERARLLVQPLPHQSELAKSLDDALARVVLGIQEPSTSLKQAADEWQQILARP